MMAPKLSGDAVLGGHHLYVIPRTMTGVIRTTARDPIAMLRGDNAAAGRTLAMALRVIKNRHQDNRMWFGKSISPINTFVRSDKF